MSMSKRALVLLIFGICGGAFFLLLHSLVFTKPPAPDYWPTQGWREAPPEDHGLSPEVLADALQPIRELDLPMHTVLVIRHGYLVTEVNVYPFSERTRQPIYSITKSIVAALVGMAIDAGYIESVDVPVVNFFPELTALGAGKEGITIHHLLTMTSGLDWPEEKRPGTSPSDVLSEMYDSDDPVRFVLERPLVAPPGEVFNYNSGTWQVLMAILARATGEDPYRFARERLFAPLGITSVSWARDKTGLPIAGNGIQMLPRDLAKVGFLYLQRGRWEEKRLLSARWVDQATRAHVETDAGWGYGYGWWVEPGRPRMFWGAGGTSDGLYVLPGLEMVVVLTGALSPRQASKIGDILWTVISATEGDQEGSSQEAGASRLRALIETLEHPPEVDQPQSREVYADLPPIAFEASGRTYVLEPNSFVRSFVFYFDQDRASMTLTFVDGTVLPLSINLDGVRRYRALGPYSHVVLTGLWVKDNVLVVKFEHAEANFRLRMQLEFSGDLVRCHLTDLLRDYSEEVTGRAR